MHGLTNRAIQCFVTDRYGLEKWAECARLADIGFSDFESMLIYEDGQTTQILEAASAVLNRPKFEFMEDLGPIWFHTQIPKACGDCCGLVVSLS